MSEPNLEIRRRNLPHWTLEGSTYFITFRSLDSVLTADERRIVLEHLRSGDGKFYLLASAVVMPDHVHLPLHPKDGFTLPRIMKGIKGVSARLINQHRGAVGTVWQDESWDRIVRDAAEFDEKLQYMANNPLKAGLAEDISQYECWYCNQDLL
jgi:putative transposase